MIDVDKMGVCQMSVDEADLSDVDVDEVDSGMKWTKPTIRIF